MTLSRRRCRRSRLPGSSRVARCAGRLIGRCPSRCGRDPVLGWFPTRTRGTRCGRRPSTRRGRRGAPTPSGLGPAPSCVPRTPRRRARSRLAAWSGRTSSRGCRPVAPDRVVPSARIGASVGWIRPPRRMSLAGAGAADGESPTDRTASTATTAPAATAATLAALVGRLLRRALTGLLDTMLATRSPHGCGGGDDQPSGDAPIALADRPGQLAAGGAASEVTSGVQPELASPIARRHRQQHGTTAIGGESGSAERQQELEA